MCFVPKNPLQAARERKGLNQGDVALQLDVTQATISNWESGRTMPHPSRWDDLARVYGVSVTSLSRHFREAA